MTSLCIWEDKKVEGKYSFWLLVLTLWLCLCNALEDVANFVADFYKFNSIYVNREVVYSCQSEIFCQCGKCYSYNFRVLIGNFNKISIVLHLKQCMLPKTILSNVFHAKIGYVASRRKIENFQIEILEICKPILSKENKHWELVLDV